MQIEEESQVKSLKALEILFENEDVSKFTVKDFVKHSDDLIEKNKVKDAEFLYEEGLKKFPNSHKLYFEYGYMMFENLDFEKAKELIVKVIARFYKYEDSLCILLIVFAGLIWKFLLFLWWNYFYISVA